MEINMAAVSKSFWYFHHHNQLSAALVVAYLFIIICTDPMYVTVYDFEILKF